MSLKNSLHLSPRSEIMLRSYDQTVQSAKGVNEWGIELDLTSSLCIAAWLVKAGSGCRKQKLRRQQIPYLRQYSRCGKGSPKTGRTLLQWQSSLQTFPMIYCHEVMSTQTVRSVEAHGDRDSGEQ